MLLNMIASSEANFIDIKAISKVRFVVELTFGSQQHWFDGKTLHYQDLGPRPMFSTSS